ncbi:hypothetical protein [Spirosoma aerolatum]|uniref:hypothetical protein n=1 Tax=Spirosoma aerolatum TaxID=1211326 RepID=UPI0009AD3198|nr:hypothetical protein [Spirosoma aerolatum]
MKIVTFLTVCLLAQVAIGQTITTTTSHWRTTVEMGVQMGQVKPDVPTGYPYYGYDMIYNPYNNYNYSYYPIRDAGNRIGLTIHAFTGYIVRPQLITGISFGVDYFNNSAFLPIAAAVQGDLFNHTKRLTPFYTLESGYAIAGPNPHGRELKGGWLLSPGVGIRINKGNGTGFLISAGYKHQEAKQVASVDGVQLLAQTEQRAYNRLYFRMGFSF